MNTYPFVSIIIPSYNRSKLITITLDSLLEQTYPHDRYEIIVVDNKSTDETPSIVKQYEKETEGRVRYFYEGRQGSHYARNNVVKYAKGELLYFTDDDMQTDARALEELVRVMVAYPNVGSVTGRVLPQWVEQPPKWLLKYFVDGKLSLLDFEGDLVLSDWSNGIFSCHQMVRKDPFIQAGGYNPDIVDGEWLGDNETGLCHKLRKVAGCRFAYVGTSVTHHIIPPHRMTQSYFNKRFANQGNCDAYTYYRQCHYTEAELRKQNRQYLYCMIKRAAIGAIQFLMGNDKWHRSWPNVYYYRNRIRYNKKLIHDSAWREMVLRDNWID